MLFHLGFEKFAFTKAAFSLSRGLACRVILEIIGTASGRGTVTFLAILLLHSSITLQLRASWSTLGEMRAGARSIYDEFGWLRMRFERVFGQKMGFIEGSVALLALEFVTWFMVLEVGESIER